MSESVHFQQTVSPTSIFTVTLSYARPESPIPIVTSQTLAGVSSAGSSTGSSAGGISILSMTWIMPLLASTSSEVTVASPIITVPSVTVKVKVSVFAASAVMPSVTLAESTAAPDIT